MGRGSLSRSTFAVALSLAIASAVAGPIEELKSVSTLPALDVQKLKSGEIVGARGAIGSFPRGVHAETAFFVRAPVETVGNALLHWNPTAHDESDVSVFREYSWPATGTTWDALNLSPNRAADRWLIERTARGNTDVHLAVADQRLFGDGAKVDTRATEIWRRILRARNDNIAAAGLPGLPAFSSAAGTITPRVEFDGLLKLAPSIAARFAPLLGGAPFITAGGANPVVPYWEAAAVRGHTNLHAGFLVARHGAGSWQVADCTYYTSDTYFFALSLYELWPLEGGTLVWEIDFASAPFRSFTAGLDRVFAGKQMVKETAESASKLRRALERH